MSRTESAIYETIPTNENVVCSAYPTTPPSTFATANDSMHFSTSGRAPPFAYLPPHYNDQKNMKAGVLPDIAVKCRTHLLSRIWMLSAREGSVTAAWIQKWQLTGTIAKPPHGSRFLNRSAYIKHYAIDTAYTKPPENNGSLKTFKKRL